MMTFDVAFVAFRAGQADAALAASAALSGDEHVEASRSAMAGSRIRARGTRRRRWAWET
jgi:hypothetical protein